MELPFDSILGAEYIRSLSTDIIPYTIREYQEKMNVPSLDPLACRFLSLCVSLRKPKNILDVGCGIGASTYAMYLGNPAASIVAFDANPDRIDACKFLLKDYANISVYNDMSEPFFHKNSIKYDFVFVDIMKKEYMNTWFVLKDHISPNAAIVFDDVLLHGYTSEIKATVPYRYHDTRRELREFLSEISLDTSLKSQIIPLGGGMLLVHT